MRIAFTKLSACGNDFVALDNRDGRFDGDQGALIRHLCERRRGAGADGLLLVERDAEADFRMRIFNPDGSEARMCGNGARACACFASSLGIGGEELRFSTLAGLQVARLEAEGRSRLWLSPPEARGMGEEDLRQDQALWEAWPTLRLAGFVRMGVPHLVVEIASGLDELNLAEIGPRLRYHQAYAPEGTNVMFVQRLAPNHLHMRAWEKGVEDETWGCGTGAVAACLLLNETQTLRWPVTVRMLGGDLIVHHEGGQLSFSGEIHLSYIAQAELPTP